jgi:hypothetical protein
MGSDAVEGRRDVVKFMDGTLSCLSDDVLGRNGNNAWVIEFSRP